MVKAAAGNHLEKARCKRANVVARRAGGRWRCLPGDVMNASACAWGANPFQKLLSFTASSACVLCLLFSPALASNYFFASLTGALVGHNPSERKLPHGQTRE